MLCVERHDAFTANNVAHTAIGKFDPLQCHAKQEARKAAGAEIAVA